jgi:hypothetical protein
VNAALTILSGEFGRGFTERNLFNVVRFAEVFPDLQDSARAECKIELDTSARNCQSGGSPEAGLLRRDVPDRRLEHTHTAPEDTVHAFRADSVIEETMPISGRRAEKAAGTETSFPLIWYFVIRISSISWG